MNVTKTAAREQFLKFNQDLYDEYGDSRINIAFWIEGDPSVDKVLFLAHGYMGSPNEMLYLAEPFIQLGWTVIGFLIPGHGGTSIDANRFKKSRWRMELKRQLSLIMETFSEVRAVGFSTGGLLLYDYFTQGPIHPSLKSVHFISPFFVQRIGKRLGVLDGLLEKLFDNIGLDLAYAISHFPDLKVMTIDRNNYNQNIPLKCAREIKELGLSIYKRQPLEKKISLPTQLFLSENDWTVDTEASKFVVFRDVEKEHAEYVWYPGKEPHHLMAPSVSSVADDVRQRIKTFIFRSF